MGLYQPVEAHNICLPIPSSDLDFQHHMLCSMVRGDRWLVVVFILVELLTTTVKSFFIIWWWRNWNTSEKNLPTSHITEEHCLSKFCGLYIATVGHQFHSSGGEMKYTEWIHKCKRNLYVIATTVTRFFFYLREILFLIITNYRNK